MQKQEFTQRTGIELTDAEYKEVETMYLEAGNMDKDEFCKDYKKHKDSTLLGVFYGQAERLKDELTIMREERSKTVDLLLKMAQTTGAIELLNEAIFLVGHKDVIKRKIRLCLPFWDDDLDYIKAYLQ